jgi:OOP family OmpA-OmpF porin
MKLTKKLGTMGVIGCAMLASQAAVAQDTFINPDWANSAWYIGAGFGQSRADIDQQGVVNSLLATGATSAAITSYERDTGYKLFLGKQLNQNFAIEGGYFDLGNFHYNATSSGNGALNGDVRFRGANLDLIGQMPLTQRLSAYGRVGVTYAKTSTHFSGNRLAALTNPDSSENKFNPKIGLGLEYKLTEALSLRYEAERYRVNNPLGKRDVDLYAVNLVYKLGRPAAKAPVVYTPPPAEPMPAPAVVEAPPAPPAPPATVSEKVSFAAEALFDFDKAVVKPAGKSALDDLLSKVQGMNTEVMITVGHTDSIGSNAYNEKLSLRRAAAVKDYLISKGVDASRIYTEGKGETQPVADNSTAEGRAKNRRVTVEVVGTRSASK